MRKNLITAALSGIATTGFRDPLALRELHSHYIREKPGPLAKAWLV